jgi:fluoride exporter
MEKWFYLIGGGILGTLARYVLSGVIYQRIGTDFPYGTLLVNLIGCFLIGFFDTVFQEKFLFSPVLRIFLMAGFCGAFTTFSTFMLETGNLIRDGETLRAFFNVILSVIIGFIVFRLGVLLGEII